MSILRLPPGPVDLTAIETDAKPGFDGDKAAGREALAAMGDDALEHDRACEHRCARKRDDRHVARERR